MDTKDIEECTSARLINGAKFYPVHLNNEELELLVKSLLKLTSIGLNSHYQVYIRKDKSSKGLDFRLQNSKGTYAAKQLMTFAINPYWKMVDFFVHAKLSNPGYRFHTVDVLESQEEEEYAGIIIPEIDSIYINRLKNPETPHRNKLFYRDEWVCVYEKQNTLQDS